jgi:hypothetical protein
MKKFICWFLVGHVWPDKWEFILNNHSIDSYKQCKKCGYKTEKCHEFSEPPGWFQLLAFLLLIAACYAVYLIAKGFSS